MTIDDFRADFKEALSGMYEPEEVASLCSMTLQHVLGMNRVEISLSRKQEIPQHQIAPLESALDQLRNSVPIQYIIGTTEFYGLSFQVNPTTLIPRPETEELVAWIISEFSHQTDVVGVKNEATKILDIGTGSGCIAVSLAKNIQSAIVEAIDISQNALATAYQNAQVNDVEVAFYNQNILETDHLDETYDIILSNPPYVRELEKKAMRENVLSNEPDSALFVPDDDPLRFYRKIGFLAFEFLNDGGSLYFEINEFLGEETVALLRIIGFTSVELRKDLFGKNRMVRARI